MCRWSSSSVCAAPAVYAVKHFRYQLILFLVAPCCWFCSRVGQLRAGRETVGDVKQRSWCTIFEARVPSSSLRDTIMLDDRTNKALLGSLPLDAIEAICHHLPLRDRQEQNNPSDACCRQTRCVELSHFSHRCWENVLPGTQPADHSMPVPVEPSKERLGFQL